MHRRAFIDLTARLAALGAAASLLPGRAFAQTETIGKVARDAGPQVFELVSLGEAPAGGLDEVRTGTVLDGFLPFLVGHEGFPLELLSELYPEESRVWIAHASREGIGGGMGGTLVRVLEERLELADIPKERIVSDSRRLRDATPGQRPVALPSADAAPVPKSVRKGVRAAAGVDAFTSQITVSTPATRDDGAPTGTVFEMVATAATDWVPASGKKGARENGIAAARICADPGVLRPGGLHFADLWEIPLGRPKEGAPATWQAGTILVSRDPVAITRVAHTILANTRRVRGLGETAEPVALREAAWLGLGEGTLARINWSKIVF